MMINAECSKNILLHSNPKSCKLFDMSSSAFPHSLLAHALAAISEGSLITDAQQKTLYANEAFSTITGYSQEEMLGQNCRILQGPETDTSVLARLRAALAEGQVFRGELLNYRKDGSFFWNDLTVTPLRDVDGRITHYVSVQRDVSDQIALQNQLRFQALHDPLTGLLNRFALEQYLPKSLARGQRGGHLTAIGMIDLDDFKIVNDSFGHEAGDSLLRELARRLQNLSREGDILARMGGDEFVIVIEGLDPADPIPPLQQILDRLHQAVETTFEIAGAAVTIGMSMGLALAPRDGVEANLLLRRADTALYQVKARKLARAAWWNLGAAVPAVISKSDSYKSLLASGGLSMFMQPVVDLRTGETRHVEALARIAMPDGVVVPPDIFLPFFGREDLNELFRLGLDQALAWLRRWDAEAVALTVSVNLAPSTLFSPDCAVWVKDALVRHGVAPARLTLELLETDRLTFENGQQMTSINQLMALGIKLSMDDFGAAYSGMHRFVNLPFDVIKTDRSFIAKLRMAPIKTLILFNALVQLTSEFERSVVVEGLEDIGMLEAIAALGASYGQGNVIARPMPPEDVAGWIGNYRLQVNTGKLESYLGALAWHWKAMRQQAAPPHGPNSTALNMFLAAHDAPAGLDGTTLTDWLVAQVQREG
jgi:diguanylate cyclase (GGDEF)-like protein/PAS domain S-box-containing protein